MEYSFFRGKRIFITGDTGFKGSWLAYWLQLLGAEVSGFALPPEREQDHYNLLGLSGKIRHTDGDIRNLEALSAAMKASQPEIVFHLAAQALVRRSYQEPVQTMETNVTGAVNLLECVRTIPGIRSLVYVTSDKCYRNNEWVWGYRENDALGGKDPYSASKAAAEIVFYSYCKSFFASLDSFGASSVRAGNVIGGGDWSEDRIVPDSIRSLIAGNPILLRNPGATRPWQHVLEPLRGYLLLAEKLYREPLNFSGSWNFGPEGHAMRTVAELAGNIVTDWGSGRVEQAIQLNAPHEAGLLHLNCDKSRHELGWQPCWDFARTVAKTVDWYKAWQQGEDMQKVTEGQIRSYMEYGREGASVI